MNPLTATLTDRWNASSLLARRVIHAAFLACVMVACLSAEPTELRRVAVRPGTIVVVVGDTGDVITEWEAPHE